MVKLSKKSSAANNIKKNNSKLKWIIIIIIIIALVASGIVSYLYFPKGATYTHGNSSGGGSSQNNTTGSPPVARFFASTTNTYAGDNITFNASESYDPDGRIIDYHWDFGDSTSQSSESPTVYHIYSFEGDYNVTLTVFDNDGNIDNCTLGMHIRNSNQTIGPYSDVLLSRENPLFPNSTSFNFTVGRDVSNITINITAVGLSYEGEQPRIGNATLLIRIYDPFLQPIYEKSYSYRGQKIIKISPSLTLFHLPGEYNLEMTINEGSTRIVITISVNYE